MHQPFSSRASSLLLPTFFGVSLVAVSCTQFTGTSSTSTGSATGGSTTGGGGAGNTSSTATTGTGGAGGMAAPMETVTVLHSDGKPIVGTNVLVNNANGTFAFEQPTDTQGVVTVDTPDGGSISIADLSSRTVQTIVAPPKGSHPRFIIPVRNTHAPISIQLNVASAPPTAKNAVLYGSCGYVSPPVQLVNQNGSLSIDGFSGCAETNLFDAWVMAFDSSGKPLAYTGFNDIDITQGSYTGSSVVWQTAFKTASADTTSFSPGTAGVDFVAVAFHQGRQAYSASSVPTSVPPEFTSSLAMPDGFDAYGLGQTTTESPADGADRARQFLTVTPTLPATSTWTASTMALPGAPMGSAGPPAILTYTLGTGAQGDAIVFSALQPDPGGAYNYSMISPVTTGATLRWPDLPDDVKSLYFGNRLTQLWVSNDDVISALNYSDYIALGRSVESIGYPGAATASAYNATAFRPIQPQ